MTGAFVHATWTLRKVFGGIRYKPPIRFKRVRISSIWTLGLRGILLLKEFYLRLQVTFQKGSDLTFIVLNDSVWSKNYGLFIPFEKANLLISLKLSLNGWANKEKEKQLEHLSSLYEWQLPFCVKKKEALKLLHGGKSHGGLGLFVPE